MTAALRAGVAGAGVFGGYHANKYALADDVTLTAIFDPHTERAHTLAERHGATPFDDYDAFLEAVDVVTVASPATTHAELAAAALSARRHVLVEKPIALQLDDAQRLIDLAAENEVVLQVGHQERHVMAAIGLFDRGEPPTRMASRRLSAFSGRCMDVSVVMDLMIHDLDLLAQLVGDVSAEVTKVRARREHGQSADDVEAVLTFSNGLSAHLAASRLAETALRDLELTYPSGRVHLDFLTREVTNDTGQPLAARLGDDALPPALVDPLRYSAAMFLNAVRTKTQPIVTGQDGLAALRLARQIEDAADAELVS